MLTPPQSDLAGVVAGLTEAEREAVMRLRPGENLMGGWGADTGCPGLIERVGINHPIFGSHYRLTPLGQQIRHLILSAKSRTEGETK